MIRRALWTFSVTLWMTLCCLNAYADPGIQPGGEAVDFKLKSTSGAVVSLPETGSVRGVILVFTANRCPYSKLYQDRLIALHNTYAPKGFPVIAINAGDENYHPDESFEWMKTRAEKKKYPFEYLYDQGHTTRLAYQPMRTPEVFLISYEGESKVVRYRGCIDDNKNVQDVTERFLEDAIKGIIEGKPFKSTARPFGSSIRWTTE